VCRLVTARTYEIREDGSSRCGREEIASAYMPLYVRAREHTYMPSGIKSIITRGDLEQKRSS